MVAAATIALASCGGGGGMPSFGDNEYPVEEVKTSDAEMQTTYPAVINGIQDVEIRPKMSGDRKSTRLNSSHIATSRMPSSA